MGTVERWKGGHAVKSGDTMTLPPVREAVESPGHLTYIKYLVVVWCRWWGKRMTGDIHGVSPHIISVDRRTAWRGVMGGNTSMTHFTVGRARNTETIYFPHDRNCEETVQTEGSAARRARLAGTMLMTTPVER